MCLISQINFYAYFHRSIVQWRGWGSRLAWWGLNAARTLLLIWPPKVWRNVSSFGNDELEWKTINCGDLYYLCGDTYSLCVLLYCIFVLELIQWIFWITMRFIQHVFWDGFEVGIWVCSFLVNRGIYCLSSGSEFYATFLPAPATHPRRPCHPGCFDPFGFQLPI